MATSNRSGPNSAANPQEVGPRERTTSQERAWLAGLAWLQGLPQDEREAAFAAIRTPAELEEEAADAPPAEALRDIARSIRQWGDAHHFGAADQLDAIAQALTALPAEAPLPDYTDDDLDDWWSALYKAERRGVLLAGIASGKFPTPEDVAAGARPAHVGGTSPAITILGNDRMVSCPEDNLREIEACLAQACIQLRHDDPPQKLLGAAVDRLVAIREGRPYVEIKRPEGARMELAYVRPADFERGVRDAEQGIFRPEQMPAGTHRESWLRGVAAVLERSPLARQRAGRVVSETTAEASEHDAKKLFVALQNISAISHEYAEQIAALVRAGRALVHCDAASLIALDELLGLIDDRADLWVGSIEHDAEEVGAHEANGPHIRTMQRLYDEQHALRQGGAA